MGFPGAGDVTNWPCCQDNQGTDPTNTGVQYVVSIGGLQGVVALSGAGVIDITTSGNTLIFGLSAGAGLGTVTSVGLTSSSSNLVVGGSPIVTNGTLTLTLAGNLGSIAGLVMAADQMLYSTGAATFAATSLTATARTLLDDASTAAMRTTLGLVIGTNVQAWSADLDSFVTNISWSGDDFTSTGGATFGDAVNISGALTATGLISGSAGASISGNVDAATFTGDGSGLTNLQAGDIASGTLAVARGGTGLASYTTGQVLYASAATTIAGLTAGAAGTFLRFAGAGVAPVVSTLVLPNAGTTGDVFIATSANTMGVVADVATGNVFLSGGVGVIPAWGKVTSSHVNSTIPTLVAGVNGDILTMSGDTTFTGEHFFTNLIGITGALHDLSDSPGTSGDILVSTGTGVDWSNQIVVSTLRIDTSLSTEGTLTPGGTTGAQTINKLSGTVRVAAAGTSVIVTNSLCTTSSYVLATCRSNDATAYVKSAVPTGGAFTINLGAAATAEVEIAWLLINFT